jgi:hypothetical protein
MYHYDQTHALLKNTITQDVLWNCLLQDAQSTIATANNAFAHQAINLLTSVRAKDNFVRIAIKRTSMAFDIERGPNGSRITRVNILGNKFYECFKCASLSDQFQLEGSPYSQIYDQAAGDLFLNKIVLNGNPSFKIGQSDFLEGELINNLILHIREIAKRKSVKAVIHKRDQDSVNAFSKAKRIWLQCIQNSPYTHVYRMNFGNVLNQQDIQQSALYLQAFIEALNKNFKTSIAGYVWDRCYWPHTGLSYHFFFFVNSPSMFFNWNALQDELSKLWGQVTGGYGCTYDFSTFNGYNGLGCGVMMPHDPSILNALKIWVKRLTLLRVKTPLNLVSMGAVKNHMSNVITPVSDAPAFPNALPCGSSGEFSTATVHELKGGISIQGYGL